MTRTALTRSGDISEGCRRSWKCNKLPNFTKLLVSYCQAEKSYFLGRPGFEEIAIILAQRKDLALRILICHLSQQLGFCSVGIRQTFQFEKSRWFHGFQLSIFHAFQLDKNYLDSNFILFVICHFESFGNSWPAHVYRQNCWDRWAVWLPLFVCGGRSFFTLIALIFLCMAEFCGQFAAPSMPSHKVRWAWSCSQYIALAERFIKKP